MSKKIQVSTMRVENPTEVQVINLNCYIIAKAVRAACALNDVAAELCVKRVKKQKLDEDGKAVFDENGNKVIEEVTAFEHSELSSENVMNLYNNVIPFITELVEAFEKGDE